MLTPRIRITDEVDYYLKFKIQFHGRAPGVHASIEGPGARRSLVLGRLKARLHSNVNE